MKVVRVTTELGNFEPMEIDGSLKSLQELVEGYIQPCAPAGLKAHGIELLCNEEGLLKRLEPNPNFFPFFFVGNLIAVGVGDEDFISLTEDQMYILRNWILDLDKY